MMNRHYFTLAVLVSLCLAVCQRPPEQPPAARENNRTQTLTAVSGTPIIISILPSESIGTMYERFLPLKYHLEKNLRIPVIIKIAKDYETVITELGGGQVHIAVLDPATYCEVRARYRSNVSPLVRVIGERGAASRSVLVTKEGTGIRKAADVRGKRLALGNQQSSFSYLIPLAMLHDVGIGIPDFESVDYLEQEDRVALSVLIGNHDVGAMSESVAEKYTADGISIIKTSEAIPRFVLCASRLLSKDLRDRILASLLAIKDADTVSTFHGTGMGGFVRADDRDFDVIRVMIKNLTHKDYIEYGPATIKVAILPLYSAITLYDRYEPLMRYLSRKTGREFKLVVPKDFDDFIDVVKSGSVDFSYQNPYVFSLISSSSQIQPLVTTIGDDSAADGGSDIGGKFRGVIIVRDDSPITSIEQLRKKKILITSYKSAGGYLSQRIYLLRKGIDPGRDMTIIDAKRQENVILGVYRGEADAGFVRESALIVWKDAVDMKRIKVLTQTSPLPNWPIALCGGRTDPGLVKTVTRLLADLKDKEVLGAARIRGFKKADESEFEALKQY
ncbi:MAG TPA: phosphate/phosphite/phosphonate ABC transporter substrate-binding protein [Nitrospirota bacterium]|nr:phosphate/phosphite/phosphonate ABC transporter substrate-binding protein [Nitrospirota bacterium]